MPEFIETHKNVVAMLCVKRTMAQDNLFVVKKKLFWFSLQTVVVTKKP